MTAILIRSPETPIIRTVSRFCSAVSRVTSEIFGFSAVETAVLTDP